MDACIFANVPNKLKYDLRVFGLEMYCYMMERRAFNYMIHEPTGLTEGSQFTEEVGKAFMVVWRSRLKDFRKMINYDFPKFAVRLEYFVRFVMFRALEIVRHSTGDLANQMAQVSAFLIELYSYCWDNECSSFLPYFVEFWGAVILMCFYGKFIGDDFPWSWFHSRCKKESKQYDRSGAETKDRDDPYCVRLCAAYFSADPKKKNYGTGDFYKKRVSKFHVLDGSNEIVKVLSPYGSVAFKDRIASIDKARWNDGDLDLVKILEESFPNLITSDDDSEEILSEREGDRLLKTWKLNGCLHESS